MEAVLLIEPSDRSATGADLDDIEHGATHRKAALASANVIGRFHVEMAILDNRAFRGRTAHIEGDDLRETECFGVNGAADTAAYRARFDQHDWLLLRALHRENAAIRC